MRWTAEEESPQSIVIEHIIVVLLMCCRANACIAHLCARSPAACSVGAAAARSSGSTSWRTTPRSWNRMRRPWAPPSPRVLASPTSSLPLMTPSFLRASNAPETPHPVLTVQLLLSTSDGLLSFLEGLWFWVSGPSRKPRCCAFRDTALVWAFRSSQSQSLQVFSDADPVGGGAYHCRQPRTGSGTRRRGRGFPLLHCGLELQRRLL